jgi:hypothetical protein
MKEAEIYIHFLRSLLVCWFFGFLFHFNETTNEPTPSGHLSVIFWGLEFKLCGLLGIG